MRFKCANTDREFTIKYLGTLGSYHWGRCNVPVLVNGNCQVLYKGEIIMCPVDLDFNKYLCFEIKEVDQLLRELTAEEFTCYLDLITMAKTSDILCYVSNGAYILDISETEGENRLVGCQYSWNKWKELILQLQEKKYIWCHVCDDFIYYDYGDGCFDKSESFLKFSDKTYELKYTCNNPHNTKHWKELRKKLLTNGTCNKCGTKERLILHHLNKECYFNETEIDVQVLCKSCHSKLKGKLRYT